MKADTEKVKRLEQVPKHWSRGVVMMLKLYMDDYDKFSKEEQQLRLVGRGREKQPLSSCRGEVRRIFKEDMF